nr:MAG TPA: hypothetical protein [Caudoviricetes sp.]
MLFFGFYFTDTNNFPFYNHIYKNLYISLFFPINTHLSPFFTSRWTA